MKRIYTWLTIFAILTFISLSGCEIAANVAAKESKCGPDKNQERTERLYSLAGTGIYELQQGNYATYYYELEVTNVCTHEHAQYDVNVFGTTTCKYREITVTAGSYWWPLFEEQEVLAYDGVVWRKQSKIGLAQCYGDGPGSYWIWCEVKFPSTGSQGSDGEFLFTNIDKIQLIARYKEFKD